MSKNLTPLRRNRYFGTDLDLMFDAIIDRLNVLASGAASATPRAGAGASGASGTTPAATDFHAPALVNNAHEAFTAGQVIGYADGRPAPACALSTAPVRAVAAVAAASAPGQRLGLVYAGRAKLALATGVAPQAGDPVFVSASQAGRVTCAAPAAPHIRQMLGIFDSPRDAADGRAWAAFIPHLIELRTL